MTIGVLGMSSECKPSKGEPPMGPMLIRARRLVARRAILRNSGSRSTKGGTKMGIYCVAPKAKQLMLLSFEDEVVVTTIVQAVAAPGKKRFV